MLEQRTIHIRDVPADLDVSADLIAAGRKSNLATPLLRDGRAIGAISLTSDKLGGFSDTQVALLETFAEQATIAITGAETYRVLQTRTSDLQEALEYQMASSDVLKVISRSTLDLQPVLEKLVETAARLCDSDMAFIMRYDGRSLRTAVAVGCTHDYLVFLQDNEIVPSRGSTSGRAALERRPIQAST